MPPWARCFDIAGGRIIEKKRPRLSKPVHAEANQTEGYSDDEEGIDYSLAPPRLPVAKPADPCKPGQADSRGGIEQLRISSQEEDMTWERVWMREAPSSFSQN